MMRRFLKETSTAGARSLSVGRHQVHDSWDQIQAYLRSVLSEDHAALFSEPFRGAGTISWMASTPAEPVPFPRLDPEQQQQVLGRLETLLADISRYAAERSGSPNPEDQQWSALLEAIQQQPADVQLADRLFAADGQPVLIQWGCRDDSTVSTGSLLRETRAMIARPEIIRALPGPGTGQAAISPGMAAMTTVPGTAWLLPALLWALFIATLAVIFWWLLAACALNLPPSLQIFGNCRSDPVIAAEQARHTELTTDLRRLRSQLAGVSQCALDQDASTAWTLPTITPSASIPPTGIAAPPATLAPVETDIDRARQQAGGSSGDITITLLWNGRSDLDLVIRCPDGQNLTGANSSEGLKCGGRIDVDANYCRQRQGNDGSVCTEYLTRVIDNPVENAFFNRDTALPGRFDVRVRHFAAAAEAPNVPIPFVVQVRNGDDLQRIEGNARPGSAIPITSFQID